MKSKLTKKQLAEIIREELADMKKDKKKKLQEMDPSWIDAAQGLGAFGAVVAGAMGIVKAGLASIKADLRKNPKYQGLSDEELEDKAGAIFKGSLDRTLGKDLDMDRWK